MDYPDVPYISAEASIVRCWPDLADRWLREWSFDGQRPVRQLWRSKYSSLMRLGQWGISTVSTARIQGDLNKRLYLMNGRHRLHAVIDSQTAQCFNLETVCYESMEHIRTAYEWYDGHQRRGEIDTLRAAGLTVEFDVPDSTLSHGSSAVRYVLQGFRPTCTVSPSAQRLRLPADVVRPWMPYVIQYLDLVKASRPSLRKPLRASPVMSIALVTLRDHNETAKAFWDFVCRDQGEEPSPSWCASTVIGDQRWWGYAQAAKWSRLIAGCWNSWFSGRTTHAIKTYREGRPILIHGTSYDGTRWTEE